MSHAVPAPEAGGRELSASPSVGNRHEPRQDKAQYAVCAGLAVLAVIVLADALRLPDVTSSNDPMGPKPVPILVGVLLLVTAAIYAWDVFRGGVGDQEAGEDVDLDQASDWKTIMLLIVVFVVNALVIQPLGWVISGTLLFTGTAIVLGSRHYVRALLIGVVLALVTFYGFVIGLGVNLPAGILQGIL